MNRFFFAFAAALWLAPALAEGLQGTLTVTGVGSVRTPPDQALIDTGVISEAASAADALADNNAAMAQVLAALEEHGIQPWDVQTTTFDVAPVYRRDEPRGQPEIAGYRAVNQVRVRVAALDALGEVLDALVRAGSNQVHGVGFGIADESVPLAEARRRAMADALSRAELYAQAAGVRVGPVLSISEQAIHVPQPSPLARGLMLEQASAVPVASGEQEITASINVVYALTD